jgi:hypothetical protein
MDNQVYDAIKEYRSQPPAKAPIGTIVVLGLLASIVVTCSVLLVL